MGSGGGGYRYFPSSPNELRELIEKSQNDAARTASDAAINAYLQSLLAVLNERDAKATREVLDGIGQVLADAVEIDQLLFGGSVAKHTYVDGLSDVDALVVLDSAKYVDKSSTQVLSSMLRQLKKELSSSLYTSIRKGEMAITIELRTGGEIQLVPALKEGHQIRVPDRGAGWVTTDPKAFQERLTELNAKLGGTLVPAIKLMKSIVGEFPDQKRIGGYHVEALAVDAAGQYSGPNAIKSVVTQLFKHAAGRVLTPISDVTGQSGAIDSGLGNPGSNVRRIVADALSAVGRRLDAANDVDQWKAVFE
ncbi:MAG: nucleotidyltransferase [Planctomycetia bacterium]|nr:nucleotidyltransferase [Planctomycetia bacterium]